MSYTYVAMVGPETGDRQIERRFAVLGMVDFVLGNLYLNVNEYRLTNLTYYTDPWWTNDVCKFNIIYILSFIWCSSLTWHLWILRNVTSSSINILVYKRSVRPCEIDRNVYFRTKPEKSHIKNIGKSRYLQNKIFWS